MTNEVEQIILEKNNNKKELEYKEKVAYKAYMEIWKFLLFVHQFDYKSTSIRFNINNYDGSYSINESDGIIYEIKDNEPSSRWNTYHEGSDTFHIKNILNTSIDYRLLFKLLYEDGFYINYLDDDNPILVYIEIDKYKVDKIIKSTLLKNKVLKLEM